MDNVDQQTWKQTSYSNSWQLHNTTATTLCTLKLYAHDSSVRHTATSWRRSYCVSCMAVSQRDE